METPIVRSQYSPRVPFIAMHDGVKITQDHFRDEVDINNIIAKFAETGAFPIANRQAEYGYATSQTFTEAMQTIASAKEEFAKLPSEARAHFLNDPAAYLDAVGDPENRELFQKLGLLEVNKRTGETQEERRKPGSTPLEPPLVRKEETPEKKEETLKAP